MKKIAVLFPGQGTQAWGMGKDLYNAYPAAKAVFDKADSLLGFPFSKNLFHNDSNKIPQSRIAKFVEEEHMLWYFRRGRVYVFCCRGTEI